MRLHALKSEPDWAQTSAFSMMTLQREACSSREAVLYTLKKHAAKKGRTQLSAFEEQIQYLIQKVEAVQSKIQKQKKH